MNRFWLFLQKWAFPILIASTYWLFDAFVDHCNPVAIEKSTLFQAVFPTIFSTELVFRGVMSILCGWSILYLEKILAKIKQLEHLLYLNEYAVERTNAFALIWTTASGSITKVNRYAASRLGYTKQELLAKTIFDITPDHTPTKWQDLLEKLKKDKSLVYFTQQRRKDGSLVDAVVYLQYLWTKNEHYQFAFVCDTFHCPSMDGDHTKTTPCGRPALPSATQILAS